MYHTLWLLQYFFVTGIKFGTSDFQNNRRENTEGQTAGQIQQREGSISLYLATPTMCPSLSEVGDHHILHGGGRFRE